MLSDFVTVTITTVSTVLARAGFGVPLILSPNMSTTARTVECTSLEEVDAVAGIGTDSPEYRMATALFSQARKPTKVILGRLANKPTLSYTIKIPTLPSTGVANLTAYTFQVTAPNSLIEQSVTTTSDSDATNAEIIDALKTYFDGLGISGITSSTSGSGDARVLILTASATGTIFDVNTTPAMRGLLWVTPNCVDAGFAADLAAIRAENDTWYAVLNPWSAGAYAIAVATAIEAISDSKKIFIARTNDTEAVQLVKGGSSAGLLDSLSDSLRVRTAAFWSNSFYSFIDAAICGLLLPTDPGSETWALKTLSGVTVDSLTPAQRANVLSYSANVYTSTAGVSITDPGKVSSGTYIDIVRGRDWLETRLAEDVFELLASLIKVPFTDAGIALVEGTVRGTLKEGVAVGLLADDPAFTVSVPRAAAVSSQNKANRILPDVKFTATLAGAVQKVQISGTISL